MSVAQKKPISINTDEVRSVASKLLSPDDPKTILTSVGQMLIDNKGEIINPCDLDLYKASSLHEFQNGVLMAESIPDKYRTFAIDMLRQLIDDYNCQTAGEKATAELAVVAFVSALDLQEQMNDSMDTHNALFYAHRPHPKDSFYGELSSRCIACERTGLEMKNRDLLGKELDRASRRYLASIQTLRILRQSPFQLSINTKTAVIGQNQIVQTNNNERIN